MSEEKKEIDKVSGLMFLGCVVAGLLGIIFALFAMINSDFSGSGLCLIAAALAFGFCVKALLNK